MSNKAPVSWEWDLWLRKSQLRMSGSIELRVYSLGSPAQDQVVFARLDEAIKLICRVQSWREQMLPRHIKRLMCVYPLGAEYVPAIDACAVGYHTVERGSAQSVAEAIIHELTHARLENCGFEYTVETQPRIEHLCVKSELNFRRAAASMPRLIRREVPVLDPWWTPERRVQHILQQLRELGSPEWLVSAAFALYRARRWFRNRIGRPFSNPS